MLILSRRRSAEGDSFEEGLSVRYCDCVGGGRHEGFICSYLVGGWLLVVVVTVDEAKASAACIP